MRSFDFGQVLSAGLKFTFVEWRALIAFALIPYVLQIAALVGLSMITSDAAQEFMLQPGVTYEMNGFILTNPETGEQFDFAPIVTDMLLFGLTMLLILPVLAVPFKTAWLRYVVLGQNVQPVRLTFLFGPREFRMLGYTVLMWLATLGVMLGGSIAGAILGMVAGPVGAMLGMIAVSLIGVWALARLYFVFPAIALDRPTNLNVAWAESSKQGMKIIGLTAVISLMFIPVAFLLVAIVPSGFILVGQTTQTIVVVFMDGVLWACLGLAYRDTTAAGSATAAPVNPFN